MKLSTINESITITDILKYNHLNYVDSSHCVGYIHGVPAGGHVPTTPSP